MKIQSDSSHMVKEWIPGPAGVSAAETYKWCNAIVAADGEPESFFLLTLPLVDKVSCGGHSDQA